MDEDRKPVILVVDDTPENIDILVGLLGETYDIAVALDGETAIRSVEQSFPDLILLDVMMPGMNGYDVCRELKSSAVTSGIPIIFLTALSAESNEKEGLELGAVDYITKPFSPPLVQCRIANHLALEKARLELKKYGQRLEELVDQRTAQLKEAHSQLRAIDEAKSEFLSAISHELRTPANGILGIGSLAIDSLPEGEEKDELQLCFEQSTQRLHGMLDSAMRLAVLQSGDESLDMEPLLVEETVKEVAEKVKAEQPEASISLFDKGGFGIPVEADRRFLAESIETLLIAAAKLNTCATPVKISIEPGLKLHISSCGEPMPEELMKTIFEPFSPERNASYVEELGLRLPVAEKMIRAMNGKVDVKNVAGAGFVITVHLPPA